MKIDTQPISIPVRYKTTAQDAGQRNSVPFEMGADPKTLDTTQFISDSKARIEALAASSVADISQKSGFSASVYANATQVIAHLQEIPGQNLSLPEVIGKDVRNIVHYGLTEVDEIRKVFGQVVTDLGGSQELADKAAEILMKHLVVDGETGAVTLDHTASWDSFMNELDSEVLSKISPIGELLSIDKKGNFRAGLNATIMRELDFVTGNNDTNKAIKLICNGDQKAANLLDIVLTGGNLFLMASGLVEGALMEGNYPPEPPKIPYPPAPEMFVTVNILGVNVPAPNLLYPGQLLVYNATRIGIDFQNTTAHMNWQNQCDQVRAKKLTDIQNKLNILQQNLDNALNKEQIVRGPDGKQQFNEDGTPKTVKVPVFEIAIKAFNERNKGNAELMKGVAQDIAQLQAKQTLGASLRSQCANLLERLSKHPDDETAQKELYELSKTARALGQETKELINRIEAKSKSMDVKQDYQLPPVLKHFEDAIVNLSLLPINYDELTPEVKDSLSGIVKDIQTKLQGGARVGFNSLDETFRTRLQEAVMKAKTEKDIDAIGNLMDFFNTSWGDRIKDSKVRILGANPDARKEMFSSLEWRNLS